MKLTLLAVALLVNQTSSQSTGPTPGAPPTREVRDDPPPPEEVIPAVPRSSTDTQDPRNRRTDGVHVVTVYSDERGHKLLVDGEAFFVKGMNWDYFPPGTNYNYSLWSQPDDFIKKALDYEMGLMQRAGINTVRVYAGMPKKWIEYIYDNYGVYTMLNHAMGRYGMLVDGAWRAPTDYSDPPTRAAIRAEIEELVREMKDTRGLLFWLLGNENNYGLYWSSNEIEDLPLEQQGDARAKFLYTMYGDMVDMIHGIDDQHPVAIANGDLQFIDLIAKYVPNLDIMGSNVYRGYSSGSLFKDVQDKLNVPFVYTEFGADAYNAKDNTEDEDGQAEYFRTLWQEIYEQSYGKGRVGNAIGGYSFQWSDGWWKYQQTINLDVQDNTASWRNQAYPHDLPEIGNNMNEEWFGVAAKSKTKEDGTFDLYPRSSYFVLKRGYELDPYASDTTLERIREHWGAAKPADVASGAFAVKKLDAKVDELALLRISRLELDLRSYYTDAALLDVESEDAFGSYRERQQRRVQSLQSFYFGVESNPARGVKASVEFNVLGQVATNPINEIFYEDREFNAPTLQNRTDLVDTPVLGLGRTQVYNASLEWNDDWFRLEGFYRVGHYHWGYEGDFFGLRPETFYGQNIDIYDANVPVGFEVEFKKELSGLKLLFGQEVYWGANPLVMGKYEFKLGGFDLAIIHQEDLSQRQGAAASSVVPQPQSRKTTLYVGRQYGPLKIELGGLMAGTPLIDRAFERAVEAPEGATTFLNSGFFIEDDQVQLVDTLGAKGKITGMFGRFNAYAQGAYKGAVASTGGDPTLTFTGWRLKESGNGNHWNALAGGTVLFGNLQVAPNFIYQKPLEEALPTIAGGVDPATGFFAPGVAPRNILDDPFSVRGNQEMLGYELMFVWDPTPATFFWQFDNRAQEDSPMALALDVVYRDYRGRQDAGIGVLANGTVFPFAEAVPIEDLIEVNLQARGKVGQTRYALVLYGGEGQANGDDARVIQRYGLEYEATYQRFKVQGFFKVDDWGPYDFHRDFNFTFPFQSMLDVSYGAVLPNWVYEAYTRIGIRTQWRLLNDLSPRFRVRDALPTQTSFLTNLSDGDNLGYELEVLTYVNISL